MKNTTKQTRLETAICNYLHPLIETDYITVDVDTAKVESVNCYTDYKVYDITIATGNNKKDTKKLGAALSDYLDENSAHITQSEYDEDDDIYLIRVDKESLEEVFPKNPTAKVGPRCLGKLDGALAALAMASELLDQQCNEVPKLQKMEAKLQAIYCKLEDFIGAQE